MSIHELPDQKQVFINTFSELISNTPKVLTDIFGAEDYTRQVYSDRFIFELLQNARDAATRQTSLECPRVHIELTENALIVANDGEPFTWNGYVAVTGIGKSSKSGESESTLRLIGRKGIGFKSVLRISKTPQIFSKHETNKLFAIGFGSKRLRDLATAAALGNKESLLECLSNSEQSWLSEIQSSQNLIYSSICANLDKWDINLEQLLSKLCQSALKIDPPSASKIDPPQVVVFS